MRVSQLLGEPEQLPVRMIGGLGDFELTPARTALVIVDVQKGLAIPGRGAKALATEHLGLCDEMTYYWSRVDEMIANLQRLRDAFRAASMEVIYIKTGSRSEDSRDLGPSIGLLRHSGCFRRADGEFISVPEGEDASDIVDELAPGPNEIVIEKYSAGAFSSTNIDSVLRYLGIESVVVGGMVTNQCVESTVREAFDHGFLPVLLADATTTWSEELQRGTLRSIGDWFCSVRTTDEVLEDIEAMASQTAAVAEQAVSR